MYRLFFIFFLFLFEFASAKDKYPRNFNLDVLHYEFTLQLSDSTDIIKGNALITSKLINKIDSVSFDLHETEDHGKGMSVTDVSVNSNNARWKHAIGKLTVFLDYAIASDDTLKFKIQYSGIPSDGLIISRNKFGNRVFFADHWPDRAHNYLPCIDHPYDKASVDFVIIAPDKYKVISNGLLIEEKPLDGNIRMTHWSETANVSTKVMAFGVASFSIENAGMVNNIPVSSWVFPENMKEGFSDYSVAIKPLEYYIRIIGDYPYKKLANVQSKTIYGGLENAGSIFYSENSVTGRGSAEALIAHEIAHQWFGDCVTENDWNHIWLSEGFATYLTSMYFESLHGKDRLKTDMESTRARILKYNEINRKPVVDTTITDLMDLLNVNSYQKGGWVLHMLRQELGDDVFVKSLRLYYKRYLNSNALTSDFMKTVEEVSGKDLSWFFRQWLFTGGQPELKIYQVRGRNKKTEIFIEQTQDNIFVFNLELLVKSSSDEKVIIIPVSNKLTKIILHSKKQLLLIPDPNIKLLFKSL